MFDDILNPQSLVRLLDMFTVRRELVEMVGKNEPLEDSLTGVIDSMLELLATVNGAPTVVGSLFGGE